MLRTSAFGTSNELDGTSTSITEESDNEEEIDMSRKTIKKKSTRKQLQDRIVGTQNKTGRKPVGKQKDVSIKNGKLIYSGSALRVIQRCQRTNKLLMRRLPFQRLVQQIAKEMNPTMELRFKVNAITALQEATETYLVGLFSDPNLSAVHAKRFTMMPSNVELVQRLEPNVEKK